MPAKIRICTNRPVYSDRRDGYTDCKPSAIGMRKCRFLRYLVWMFRLSAMAAVYNLNNPHCSFFIKGTMLVQCYVRTAERTSLLYEQTVTSDGSQPQVFPFSISNLPENGFLYFRLQAKSENCLFCVAAIWQMFQNFTLFKWLQ